MLNRILISTIYLYYSPGKRGILRTISPKIQATANTSIPSV